MEEVVFVECAADGGVHLRGAQDVEQEGQVLGVAAVVFGIIDVPHIVGLGADRRVVAARCTAPLGQYAFADLIQTRRRLRVEKPPYYCVALLFQRRGWRISYSHSALLRI